MQVKFFLYLKVLGPMNQLQLKMISQVHQKIRKLTTTIAANDISAINHKNSDTGKFNILTDNQNSPQNFDFPKHKWGMKSDGKPHMQSFLMKWLDDYQSDGLVYSVIELVYCKFCRIFLWWKRSIGWKAI